MSITDHTDISSDAAVHDLDPQLRPTLDTTDDPTGAAFVLPLLMFLVHAASGLAFVVAHWCTA